jgi:hypothetical protein
MATMLTKMADVNIPTNQFATLKLYAQYSTAAYCSANFAALPGANITCPGAAPGACSNITNSRTEIVDSFTLYDTVAMLCR